MRQGDSTTIDSLDGNSIDSTELLKILNFTLKVIGEDGNFQSLSNAMGKIQSINGSGVDHGKIDTVTGLSVIGTRWKEKGYLRLNSGLSAINKTKLMESVYWKS
ncbi:MAG: hypothetical protein H6767_07250 [Candidatus Peribacteria bacterium]|nr:MAG: hypothetical protein H6767_07250 [Candidatus Peribacteria bacterium]